jgi:uncharacterized protein (DUF1697 family)
VKYVALLRGINVGGTNRVAMGRLKGTFQNLGHGEVRTYINSGNVLFTAPRRPVRGLADALERRIVKDFGVEARVLVLPGSTLRRVAAAIPAKWSNDQSMKCDVLFLWPEFASAKVVDQFQIDRRHEDIRYSHPAILWRVNRSYVTRSAMMKLVGSDLYAGMTIRNCNTVRKLDAMLAAG